MSNIPNIAALQAHLEPAQQAPRRPGTYQFTTNPAGISTSAPCSGTDPASYYLRATDRKAQATRTHKPW